MEQEEDQLSNLPITILHNVLSRQPKKDVARTSVLSKVWLEIWYTFPILSFSDTKITEVVPQSVEDLPRKSKDFIEYVKSRLLRFWDRRLAIKEFNLSVNFFELGYKLKDVDRCLKLASESGVEVFELYNGRNKNETEQDVCYIQKKQNECYVLPKCVIEAKSLTKLVLMGGIRVDQAFMNHSIKFFSLRELYLWNVCLKDEQAIEHLISYCPLIESITLIFGEGMKPMKSLSIQAVQKLKTVRVKGVKELYIDEAPNLENLRYYGQYLYTPFKIDSIRCQNVKELFLSLNKTDIITNKWFLELFLKFRFLERLELFGWTMSEQINISNVQLKFLKLSYLRPLKEVNIDAPNLLSCTMRYYSYESGKPIVSFLRSSSQLEVNVEIILHKLDVLYVREVLQKIKPQNVMISLSLPIIEPIRVAHIGRLLDILTPPPSIKHLDLLSISIDYEIMNVFTYLLHFLLLCCCPKTISFKLDTSPRAFIEFFYETLRIKKDNDRFYNSKYTKCWWHDLKDVKIANSMKNDENVDLKTMLDSLSTSEFEKKISFMLEF